MSLSRLGLIALAVSFATITPFASATPVNTFTVQGIYSGYDSNQSSGKINITFYGQNQSQAAGNFAGSTGVINGTPVAFSQVYCVDLSDYIWLSTTYTASYNTTGVVNGSSVNNDGAIAFLLLNEAPLATTDSQDEGLQAAIWKEEYGANFTLSSSNSSAVINAYNADLAALSGVPQSVLTADISKLEWITPTLPGYTVQGQVGILAPTPEPGGLVLLGTGILGVAGLTRRRFKKA